MTLVTPNRSTSQGMFSATSSEPTPYAPSVTASAESPSPNTLLAYTTEFTSTSAVPAATTRFANSTNRRLAVATNTFAPIGSRCQNVDVDSSAGCGGIAEISTSSAEPANPAAVPTNRSL